MNVFKVLLVDDEPLITRGLEALVDWEDYGFEIAYISEDGEDALQYIKEHKIDLLVTDIVMPKRTGLELIEEARKYQSELKCMILSGYEEFDYVKQGIKLGIENYLVKPVDEVELVQTVQSISEKLLTMNQKVVDDSTYTLKRNTLWRLVNDEISQSEWKQRLSFYDIDSSRPFYSVSSLEFSHLDGEDIYAKTTQKIEGQFGGYCITGSNQEILIILHADEEEALYEKNEQLAIYLKNECPDIGTFYIVMGDPVDSMDQISESYFQAREYSLYQIVIEPNTVISNRVHIDKHTLLKNQQNYKSDLVKRILDSHETVEEGIDLFFQFLSKKNEFFSLTVARKYTIDLVTYIHYSIQDVKHYKHTATIEKLVHVTEKQAIKETLRDYCLDLVKAIDEQHDIRSPIIQNVLDYMHTYYNGELSLKTLSQRFHVNPIYLGQLFQKEMGVVFSEYINHFRLEKAKELLTTTHFRAGEIGKQVGYSDTAYFYKQFKRHVGITPTEWRKI